MQGYITHLISAGQAHWKYNICSPNALLPVSVSLPGLLEVRLHIFKQVNTKMSPYMHVCTHTHSHTHTHGQTHGMLVLYPYLLLPFDIIQENFHCLTGFTASPFNLSSYSRKQFSLYAAIHSISKQLLNFLMLQVV